MNIFFSCWIILIFGTCSLKLPAAAGVPSRREVLERFVRDALACGIKVPPGMLHRVVASDTTSSYMDTEVMEKMLLVAAPALGNGFTDFLIQHKADVNGDNAHLVGESYRYSQGSSPLHLAVTRDECLPAVNALLKARADLNTPNHEGRTPLQDAALFGGAEVFGALMKAQASSSCPKQTRQPLVNILQRRLALLESENSKREALHKSALEDALAFSNGGHIDPIQIDMRRKKLEDLQQRNSKDKEDFMARKSGIEKMLMLAQ